MTSVSTNHSSLFAGQERRIPGGKDLRIVSNETKTSAGELKMLVLIMRLVIMKYSFNKAITQL